MDSLTNGLKTLKTQPTKMAILKEYANGDFHKMLEVVQYANALDAEGFEALCSFKEDDWFAYGACKEEEYFFNRDEEDIPEDKRREGYHYGEKDRETLTEEQFNKVLENNPSKTLTYELYKAMSESEHK